jgi:hypothetical protein
VSFPTGVTDELHVPEPPDSVAVHRGVDPVEKMTEPVGVPEPNVGVTVAEYVTAKPDATGLGLAMIEVCVGLTTRVVVPVEAA